MSHFDKYSLYYDLCNKDKDYRSEVRFIQGLMEKYGTNPKSLIELGCGSGVHAEFFAASGVSVKGIDLSEGMVEPARERQKNSSYKDKLDFHVGDITDFDFETKADSAISLFHVMTYLTTNKKLESAIQNTRKHLNIGGLFLFDFWYGPAVLNIGPSSRTREMEDDKISVVRVSNPDHDSSKCKVDVHFTIDIMDKISSEKQTLNEVHPCRYFFIPELTYFLEKNGFEVLEFGEWMTSNKPTNDTWGVYTVARAR